MRTGGLYRDPLSAESPPTFADRVATATRKPRRFQPSTRSSTRSLPQRGNDRPTFSFHSQHPLPEALDPVPDGPPERTLGSCSEASPLLLRMCDTVGYTSTDSDSEDDAHSQLHEKPIKIGQRRSTPPLLPAARHNNVNANTKVRRTSAPATLWDSVGALGLVNHGSQRDCSDAEDSVTVRRKSATPLKPSQRQRPLHAAFQGRPTSICYGKELKDSDASWRLSVDPRRSESPGDVPNPHSPDSVSDPAVLFTGEPPLSLRHRNLWATERSGPGAAGDRSRTPEISNSEKPEAPATLSSIQESLPRDSAVEIRLRELVKENVFLTREVERLADEVEASQRNQEAMKDSLMNVMTEKHEKRIGLLKEEYEFRAAQERDAHEQELVKSQETIKQANDKARTLESRIQELEIAARVSEEKSKQEERQMDRVQQQNKSLEEQVAAALNTVSQFSEKHQLLQRKIETLQNDLLEKQGVIDSKDRHIERLKAEEARLHTVLGAKNEDVASLTQKLQDLTEEIKISQVSSAKQQEALALLQATVSNYEKKLEDHKALEENMKKALGSQDAQLRSQRAEIDVLQRRNQEYRNIAQTSWEETQSLKKEADLLRHRLEQQYAATVHLKDIAAQYLSQQTDVQPNLRTSFSRGTLLGQARHFQVDAAGKVKEQPLQASAGPPLLSLPLSDAEDHVTPWKADDLSRSGTTLTATTSLPFSDDTERHPEDTKTSDLNMRHRALIPTALLEPPPHTHAWLASAKYKRRTQERHEVPKQEDYPSERRHRARRSEPHVIPASNKKNSCKEVHGCTDEYIPRLPSEACAFVRSIASVHEAPVESPSRLRDTSDSCSEASSSISYSSSASPQAASTSYASEKPGRNPAYWLSSIRVSSSKPDVQAPRNPKGRHSRDRTAATESCSTSETLPSQYHPIVEPRDPINPSRQPTSKQMRAQRTSSVHPIPNKDAQETVVHHQDDPVDIGTDRISDPHRHAARGIRSLHAFRRYSLPPLTLRSDDPQGGFTNLVKTATREAKSVSSSSSMFLASPSLASTGYSLSSPSLKCIPSNSGTKPIDCRGQHGTTTISKEDRPLESDRLRTASPTSSDGSSPIGSPGRSPKILQRDISPPRIRSALATPSTYLPTHISLDNAPVISVEYSKRSDNSDAQTSPPAESKPRGRDSGLQHPSCSKSSTSGEDSFTGRCKNPSSTEAQSSSSTKPVNSSFPTLGRCGLPPPSSDPKAKHSVIASECAGNERCPLTRLVKVVSSNGICRYELQTLSIGSRTMATAT